jgi:putative membrane protein
MIRHIAFPSTKAILTDSIMLPMLGIGLSFLISQRKLGSLLFGAAWGAVAFTIPAFLCDVLLYFTIMKKDSLFYLRRCLALSLFTSTLWVIIFFFSAIVSVFNPRFVFPDFAVIVGLFAVVPLRTISVFSISRTSFAERTVFALLEPAATVVTTVFVFGLPIERMITGLVLASIVGFVLSFGLITLVETKGRKAIGFSPIRMFRAFLRDWLEGDNEGVESYLSELGVATEIDAAAFAFRKKGSTSPKGIMLVSSYHPGPFLNIGSSVIPYTFQALMRKRFSAVAMVPHGVSGHELNLVSQGQNEKLLEWVLSGLMKAHYASEATPVTRMTNETATATSQVFDGSALVTMTTSPLDMEDVPSVLASNVAGLTHGRFRTLALIDAHNSLVGPASMTPQKVGALQEAALASLQVSAEASRSSFKAGVFQSAPPKFTLKDGFGPAGIAVIAVEVEGQKFAYITIDGNNMTRGLREEILRHITDIGFDDAEVMTTDTHMVNGVVHARLGYHPIGEVVAWEPLLNEVMSACKGALADLEECEVGVVSGQIPVMTLGQKSLRGVMSTVYKTSKLTALTLFPIVIAVTILSLLFLVQV